MDNSMSRILTASNPVLQHSSTSAEKSGVDIKTQTKASDVKDTVQIGTESKQAPAASKMVKANVYPQDPYVGKPVVEEIEQSKIGTKLSGPRAVAIDKNNPKAIADTDGNFFYDPVKPEFDQVNSFIVSYKTLDMHETNLEKKVKWAFGREQISVNSHAGEGANAYYSRWSGGVSFLEFNSDPLDKRVQTSKAMDIISHEIGHAVLDGMKPNLLSSMEGENRAFHEAFADSTAFLYSLKNDENVKAIIQETGGNLRNESRLTRIGEEFGAHIALSNDDPGDDGDTYIRSVLNDFKYVPASTLPSSAPRPELSSGPHSFSRIFSGAFYDLLDSMYQKDVASQSKETVMNDAGWSVPKEPDREAALKNSGDVLGKLLVKAVDMAPSSSCSFKNVATAMLRADEVLNEGKNKKEIASAFLNRNILTSADIGKFEMEKEKFGGITLENLTLSQDEGLAFLNKNGGKLDIQNPQEYRQMERSTDKDGNTILHFTKTREIPLSSYGIQEIAGQKDLSVDVEGSLSLVFDPKGKLAMRMEDDITRGKIDEVMSNISGFEKEGLIRRQPVFKSDNLFKTKNVPYEAEVYQEPSGKFKLRRIPIAVD